MRFLASALLLLGVSACQVVLGDFTVESSEQGELGSACRPDEYRCTGAELEVCAGDRRSFVAVETCTSPDLCSVGTGSCRACAPGELECRGQTLVQCGADSTWTTSSECGPNTRCRMVDGTGSCSLACVAGALQCDGPRLLQCNGEGTFEESELCETPELCLAALQQTLSSGTPRSRCASPACEPGQFSCDGATLRRCNFARDGWDAIETCPSAELCNPAAGDCSACTPDELSCAGPALFRCSSASGFAQIRTCTSNRDCLVDEERCKQAECRTPGAVRCAAANGLEVCSEGGGWEVLEACVTAGLCSASEGRCYPPACVEKETRCVGSEWQECSADLSRFERKARCTAGSMCDPVLGCVPGACTDGQTRCNGLYLERCVAGVFERERRCATAALCDAAGQSCRAPECDTPYFCDDSSVQKCDAGRTASTTLQVCIEQETCDPGYAGLGPGRCAQCTPGVYSCDGSTLRRCAADGLAWTSVAECDNACDPSGRCS